MADDKNLDSKSIAEALVQLTKAKGTYQEILAIAKQYNSTLGLSKSLVEDMEETLNGQAQAAKELLLMSNDTRRTQQQMLAAAKVAENIEESMADIARDRAKASADLLLKETMLKTGLTGNLAEQAKNLALAKQLGAITESQYQQQLAGLIAEQKSVKVMEDQVELLEEIARKELEARQEVEKYTKSWEKTKAMMISIAKDPELNKTIFKGLLIKKSVELIKDMRTEIADFRKEGLSVTQTFKSLGQTLSFNSLILGQDTKGALLSLQDTMGNIRNISTDTVNKTAGLAQAFGITGNEAGQLVGNMSNLAGMTQTSAANMATMTGRLAISSGVKPGAVLKDMAKNSENMAKFSAKGGESFARAAVGAAKMGLEVGKLAQATEGLLDFENSINKQMEASVLLGREINLDKARELTLNGDLAGATKEMLKNVGGEAEFNRMNLIQKKALAESMGMSVEDMGKMVKHQNEFTEAQTKALQQGKSLDEVLAMGAGFVDKAAGLFSKDNLMLVFTAMNAFKGTGGVFSGMTSAFKAVKDGGASILKSVGTGIKGMFGGGAPKIQAPSLPKTDGIADAGKKMGGPGMMLGFKNNMKSLASGFKQMGQPGVLMGIVNTALAGPALILALPSIPYLLFMGLTPLKMLKSNLSALASGLSSMGTGKVALGSLNLMLFSVAAVVGVAALPFFAMMLMGKLVGAGLKGLAGGLKAMGDPVVAFGAAILSMVLLSAGASMLMFGAGVGIAAAGMSLLVKSLKDVPFQNLLALPLAFMGIAAGLGLMAYAGMAALPVLAALTAFALVAPALTSLGSAIGGMFGGGKKEEGKEDTSKLLLEEIRGLRADLNRGGVINMDGQKVGEVVRLAINSAGVR